MKLSLGRLRASLQRQGLRISLGLVMLGIFAAHTIHLFQLDFMERLESIAYDQRLVLTMPGTVDDRIVIVEIDEKSLAREGRWPWSRAKMATLVDQLFDRYGAYVVGFDIVFAEPEETSGLTVIERLGATEIAKHPQFQQYADSLKRDLDYDQQFARSLVDREVVLGVFFADADAAGEKPRAGVLPPPAFTAQDFAGRNIPFVRSRGYAGNLAPLQANARAAGHLMNQPDSDGVVRRVPLLFEYDNNFYEALSVAVTRVALGVDRLEAGFPQIGASEAYTNMEWLSLGGIRIPVDERVQALVPFRGRQGSFPYVSATDVLRGEVNENALRDRIILIGATAEGLLDIRATPVSPKYPGVEVHANLIAGMLDYGIKENPAYATGAEFIFLVVSGAVMALVLPVLSPLWAAATTVGLLVSIVGVNLAAWKYANLAFPVTEGVLAILALFLFNMSWGFFVESRGKRQLANRFGQYVPPELVNEMSVDPSAFTMDTRSRNLTVLFSDVRDFTTISEGLSPQELSDVMNAYLSPMTRIIYDYRGTIDKYMGDAIMAFWGSPLADPEHAKHAMETAMAMSARLRVLREEFENRGWPHIRIGVGLNTGMMNVGNMGSQYRVAYTVMGDAVNLGSRLEGLTKEYGVEIIVSESTKNAVPEYAYRELDRVRVKGKDEPVTIYEPLGIFEECDERTLEGLIANREALQAYREQDWDTAENYFQELSGATANGRLYTLFLERIAHFRQAPPGSNWDGVFTHKTK
ncbi:MAG TPA: adenylate/guanylate cyclase domain-containing protein [Gammaproteobacteria bacterium]